MDELSIRIRTQNASRAASDMDSVASSARGVGEGADDATGGVGRLGKALEKLGPIGVAAGAAAGAGLALGLGTALEGASAQNSIQTQLGLDDSSAYQAGKDIGALYAKGYGASIAGVTDTLAVAVQTGLGDLDDGTANTAAAALLNLESTFGAGAQETGRTASKLLATGLAENSGEAFNILTAGFQAFGKDSDFSDSLNEYSTQFRDLGLSGEDALGLFRQGLEGGARDTDIVADSLKELNIRVKSLDPKTASGLKTLGLDADAMADAFAKGGPVARDALSQILGGLSSVEDPAEQSRLAVALFGTQAEDMAGALGALDLSNASKQLGGIGGAARKLDGDLTKGPVAKMELLRRKVMAGLAAAATKVLLPALNAVAGALLTIGTTGGKVIDFLRPAAPFAVGLATALLILNAPLIATTVAFGAWAVVLWVQAAAAGAAAIATGALAGVMGLLASPILLVVAALAGLAVGFKYAWDHSEKFRAFATNAFNSVKAAGVGAWTWIKNAWGNAGTWLSGVADSIKSAFSGIWDGVKNGAKSAINFVIGLWNKGFDLINAITPGAFKISGETIIPAIPDIPPIPPLMAQGGVIRGNGSAIVGDAGAEELSVRNGVATVTPLTNTPGSGGAGGTRATVVFRGPEALTALFEQMVEYIDIQAASA